MISTIKNFLLLSVCLLGLSVSNLSAQEWTKSIKGEFNRLTVFGRGEVKLVPDGSNEIRIKASGIEEKDVKVAFKSGECDIKVGTLMKSEDNFEVTIEVGYTALEKIVASAGIGMFSNEILDVPNSQIKVLSGAQFEAQVMGANLNMDVAQGAQARLIGEVDNFNLNANTGAIVEADQLNTKSAEVKSNTGAQVDLGNCGDLDAKASTGGMISYQSITGKLKTKTSLGGDVYSGRKM